LLADVVFVMVPVAVWRLPVTFWRNSGKTMRCSEALLLTVGNSAALVEGVLDNGLFSCHGCGWPVGWGDWVAQADGGCYLGTVPGGGQAAAYAVRRDCSGRDLVAQAVRTWSSVDRCRHGCRRTGCGDGWPALTVPPREVAAAVTVGRLYPRSWCSTGFTRACYGLPWHDGSTRVPL
jgi:hypothetical protein